MFFSDDWIHYYNCMPLPPWPQNILEYTEFLLKYVKLYGRKSSKSQNCPVYAVAKTFL